MTSESPLTFPQLGLSERICSTLSKLGYEQPSSIQERSIPPLLEGRDLLGVAQTGTGKTAAFALPLISEMPARSSSPAVLVLTPTRELCIQVAEAIESYAEGIRGLKVLPVYGGQDMSGQIRQLKKGVQIVVGTPGRIMDHMRRKTLNLSGIQSVVLDEADEMLRMGFIDDVEWILEQAPDKHQLALFSATMPAAIKRIATKYLKDPVEVRIESATKTVDSIEQSYIEVNNARKLGALDLVLETEDFDGVIVFVRTKTSAQELSQKLEIKGYRASSIHGDLNQRQRELCIRQLKDSVIDVVVATDVAARGIDVPRVTHVINYDIPYDGESYIHRIGRTGRAGRSGKAILFVTQRERRMLNTIERLTGQSVAPMKLPTAAELKQIRVNRFAESIKSTLHNTAHKQPLDEIRASLGNIQESTGLSYEDIALALCHQSHSGKSLAESKTNVDFHSGHKQNARKERGQNRSNEGRDYKRGDSRGDKKRESKPRSERVQERENIPMDTYRLDVGREHAVRVGDILGAVANELGIESRYIGEIILEDNQSRIDLPKDMPKELFEQFKRIRIRNYPAKPELTGAVTGESKPKRTSNAERKPRKRPVNKSKSDGGEKNRSNASSEAKKPGKKTHVNKRSANTKPGRKTPS